MVEASQVPVPCGLSAEIDGVEVRGRSTLVVVFVTLNGVVAGSLRLPPEGVDALLGLLGQSLAWREGLALDLGAKTGDGS